MRYKIILSLATIVLLAAVALQIVGAREAKRAAATAREPALFATLDGIGRSEGQPLPVATSEFLTREVERTLRYTSAASYAFEGGAVTLYAGLWAPDSVSIREVAFHTPDHCWVVNGWKRLEKIKPEKGGRVLQEGQQRLFEKDGRRLYTACWHIVGGRCVIYNEDGPPDNFSMISDFFRFGLAQRRSQIFVRVTSPVPLESLEERKYVREILRALEQGTSP